MEKGMIFYREVFCEEICPNDEKMMHAEAQGRRVKK